MIFDPTKMKEVPNLEGQTCFGCGTVNPQGLKMTFSSDDNKVYSHVRVPAAMTGWDQAVHGGILATIIDEIMGWTVIHLTKKIGVTRSMTVDYLKPVVSGEQLSVVGAVLENLSERSVLITGEIYNSADILSVRGKGKFSTMNPRTAVRLGVISPEYMQRFTKLLE